MIHLAAIGCVYEGPGLAGRVITTLNSPVATLCGENLHHLGSIRVIMPHDDTRSCRTCLRLLPTRNSEVVPLLLPEA